MTQSRRILHLTIYSNKENVVHLKAVISPKKENGQSRKSAENSFLLLRQFIGYSTIRKSHCNKEKNSVLNLWNAG